MVNGAQSKDFGDSVGLIGALQVGLMLARDVSTVLADHNAFRQEWQVLDTEPKIFKKIRLLTSTSSGLHNAPAYADEPPSSPSLGIEKCGTRRGKGLRPLGRGQVQFCVRRLDDG
jgi:hypothetical protein